MNKANEGLSRDSIKDLLIEHRKVATPYKNVVIEVVGEEKVRAKANHTRVFIPLNEEVLKFYNNIGKWFLHFSEPKFISIHMFFKF